MQWFRQYAEFSTDPKVQMMPESYQRRLVMLFCMRCKNKELIEDEEIIFQLRITAEEWQETKKIFIKRGFIDKDNKVLNWDKRQYISDLIDPTAAERQRRYRNNRNATVTDTVTSRPPEQIQNRTDTEQKGKKAVSSLIFKENLCKSIRARIKSGDYVSSDDKKFVSDFESEIKTKLKKGEI